MNMNDFSVIIFASGAEEGMNSRTCAPGHKICGRMLCEWAYDAAEQTGAECCAVAADNAGAARDFLAEKCARVYSKECGALGDALKRAADESSAGAVVLINAAAPLLTAQIITDAVKYYNGHKNAVTAVCAHGDLKGADAAMYVTDRRELISALDFTGAEERAIESFSGLKDKICASGVNVIFVKDKDSALTVSDRVQLAEAQAAMSRRINETHMRNGVTIYDPASVTIEAGVQIGRDTVIDRGVLIRSGSVIGSGCHIGMGTTLDRAVIGDDVDIQSSVIIDSEVKKNTNVGPFAYIRPGSVVGENVKVGDFVEVKNAVIGNGTKIAHLTYVGDADVGERVNFGCGTVVVNYDGQNKHRTTIGNDVFIGCNTNLVSPVVVNDGAFTAAGSTITDEVPENALAIARARQVNKQGWERPKKIKK